MYLLPDGVLARLTVAFVGEHDEAVRLSYPGIRMHAGYMDAREGLIVAFAHGPGTGVGYQTAGHRERLFSPRYRVT